MTFKHITFGESPVMRSLEKVAMERGMFEPDPVVKEASVEKLYEPTESLLNDMFLLANGLRENGFIVEADALEDKILEHKQAAKAAEKAVKDQGEKMLDDAHPEGDVEVAPSQSGYGKMLTQKTTQDEIKKIINKMPTGKLANKQAQLGAHILAPKVGYEMAVAFGKAMGPYVGSGYDADDIKDAVRDHLSRILVTDLKDYQPNQMQVVADLFTKMVNAEAVDWALKMQEDQERLPDYDMEEGLRNVAGNIFATATGRMQSMNRGASPVIENIIKAAEYALNVNAQESASVQDLSANIPSIEAITQNHTNLALRIGQKEAVGDVVFRFWGGEVSTLFRFEENEAKQVGELAAPKIRDYLLDKAKQGYDPVDLNNIITDNINEYWGRYLGKSPAGQDLGLNELPELDYSFMLHNILYADPEMHTLSKTQKFIADERAKKTKKRTEEEEKSILAGIYTWEKIYNGLVSPLNNVVRELIAFNQDTSKDETAGANALKQARYWKSIVSKIEQEQGNSLQWPVIHNKFNGTKFYQYKTWTSLIVAISSFESAVVEWVKKPGTKEGSEKVELRKAGQQNVPEPGEPKETPEKTAPKQVGVGSGYNVVTKMQEALKALSDEYAKSQPKRASALKQGGIDGDWQNLTQAALVEAEKVRNEMGGTGTALVSWPSSVQAANANTTSLTALIKQVKTGAGSAYQGKGESLGEYNRPVSKEMVEVFTGDLRTLSTFLRFLENTGLIHEVGNFATPPGMTVTDLRVGDEALAPEPTETPTETSLTASRKEELSKMSQNTKRTIKTELFDPEPGPDPEPEISRAIGLTYNVWAGILKHFEDEAAGTYWDESIKDKTGSKRLYNGILKLKELLDRAKTEQNITPEQAATKVINLGEGTPYNAPSGRRTIVEDGKTYYVVIDPSGKRWRIALTEALRPGYRYEGSSYSLGPSALRPPVSHILDLRSKEFGMPQAFKRRLTFNSFSNTPGADIIGMFSHMGPTPLREIQAQFALVHNIELVKWYDKYKTYHVKHPQTGKAAWLSALKLPGYNSFVKELTGTPKDKAMGFLKLALSRLSKAYAEWEQSVPEAESERMTKTETWFNKWRQLLRIKYGKVENS